MTANGVLHCQSCGGPTNERPVEGRLRPVCERCGAVTYLDPKLAVAVVLQRDGKVLMGRRGASARAAGKWSFPAGFVERGEVVEDAALREVKEETGFSIVLGPLLALLSSPGETVVLAVYTGTIVDGDQTAGDDLVELGWFDRRELPELAFPHDREILEAMGKRQ
jgi:8-oxo-dGTP diphosphatase